MEYSMDSEKPITDITAASSATSAALVPHQTTKVTPENLTAPDLDRIMEFLSQNMDESPLRKQYYLDAEEAKRNDIISQHGSAFDKNLGDDEAKSMICDMYVSRSSDGKIQAVLSFAMPGSKYYKGANDTSDCFSRYSKACKKNLESIEGRQKWIDSLEPTFRILDRSLTFNSSRGIKGIVLQTDPATRSKGHGTELLKILQNISAQTRLPVHLTATNPRAVNLYMKGGCTVTGSLPITTPDCGECVVSALKYIPPGGMRLAPGNLYSIVHRAINLGYRWKDREFSVTPSLLTHPEGAVGSKSTPHSFTTSVIVRGYRTIPSIKGKIQDMSRDAKKRERETSEASTGSSERLFGELETDSCTARYE